MSCNSRTVSLRRNKTIKTNCCNRCFDIDLTGNESIENDQCKKNYFRAISISPISFHWYVFCDHKFSTASKDVSEQLLDGERIIINQAVITSMLFRPSLTSFFCSMVRSSRLIASRWACSSSAISWWVISRMRVFSALERCSR
jgi:hypothetical protein